MSATPAENGGLPDSFGLSLADTGYRFSLFPVTGSNPDILRAEYLGFSDVVFKIWDGTAWRVLSIT